MPRTALALSAERIVAAAIDLADREGMEALTMRRLGTDLGVEAMSLYRYLPRKDAVLDAVVDAIVAQWTVPRSPDWRVSLAATMHRAHDVLLEHPWSVELLSARPHVGPGRLRYAEAVTAILLDAGFPPALAHRALHVVDGTVLGFSAQDARRPSAAAMGGAVRALYDGELVAQYPAISRTIREPHDHAEEYALMVELVIDGLDRLRAGAAGPAVSPAVPPVAPSA